MLLILKTALAFFLLQGSPQCAPQAPASVLHGLLANDPPAQPLPPVRPQPRKKS